MSIRNLKTFTEAVSQIDWLQDRDDTLRDFYRTLERMAEVIEYARRGGGEGPEHNQKMFFDVILAERSVQLDQVKHDAVVLATTELSRQIDQMLNKLFDFGNSGLSHYFQSVASFNWAANRTELTTKARSMRRWVTETGGLIEKHWNRQCELNECPHLATTVSVDW